MIETTPFPYSTELKTQILAIMLRDKSFIQRKRHILSHKYFENPAFVFVARTILDFYDRYDVPPSEDSLLQILSQEEKYKLYKVVVDKLLKADVSNADYISDEVTGFCTQQALRLALYLSEEALKAKEYDKIPLLIEKAMLKSEDNLLDGFKLSESVELIKSHLNPDNRNEYKIATLISGMDRILRGGVAAGELHCIFAPTKRGKSILLNNLAFACALQGKKATYISLEMDDKQVATRTHMRLSGMSDSDLLDNKRGWMRSFRRLMKNGGDIYYKRFPTKRLTLDGLDSFLDRLWKVENFSTDLLIVDYLDLLKGDRNYDSSWQSQGPLAEGLKGLVIERNCSLWTASQAGKMSGSKEQLTEEDMKGDSVKNDTVDSLWSILQSKEELVCEPPRGRIKCNLLRDGHGMGTTIPIVFDKSKMYMGDLDEAEADVVPF